MSNMRIVSTNPQTKGGWNDNQTAAKAKRVASSDLRARARALMAAGDRLQAAYVLDQASDLDEQADLLEGK